MRLRTGWRGTIVVAAAAVLLAGCAPGGGGDSGGGGQQPQSSGDFRGKTLTYLYFTDGPDEQATRDAIAAFQKETGAKVDLQIIPFADLEASLRARLSGGQAPDVVRLADIAAFRDDLLDLAPYVGKDYADQFIDGMVTAAKSKDGGLLAVPSDLTMNGPFINLDMFQKAGIQPPTNEKPWTWDEMLANADKARQAARAQYSFAMDRSGHRVSTVLSQFGTRLITDGKETLDQAKAEKAIGTLTGLMTGGKADKDFWLASGSKYKGANEIFLAQATPVYLSGNWQVSQFAKATTFNWKAIPNPCAEQCGGFPGGKFIAALAKSDTPDLAAAFIKFSTSKEQQTALDIKAQFLPTRKDLVAQGVSYTSRSDDMAAFLADVKRTAQENYGTNTSPAFGVAAKAVVDEMSKVVAGQEDVATAVRNIKKATDTRLKEVGE
ncbi:MAG TPA: extracellular solute-binding protein [Pseudonocardiaceae bacterium]